MSQIFHTGSAIATVMETLHGMGKVQIIDFSGIYNGVWISNKIQCYSVIKFKMMQATLMHQSGIWMANFIHVCMTYIPPDILEPLS